MNTILFLNGQDWLIVLILVLLLFGGKKIPELMRGLGRGVREFNDAKSNVQSEIRKGMEEEPKNKEA
jgi:sec-independent protein translocase protein TatA